MSLAAEKFLKAPFDEKRIQEMLDCVGRATEVSRVYIFENRTAKDGTLLTSQRHEWVAPGIEPQMGKSDLHDFSWQTGGMGRWEKNMSKGNIIQGHVRTFPKSEQEILTPQEIKSIVAVPIFIGQKWWGFIGFDECLAEREWSIIETDALKVAAGILGAAIQHKRANEELQESGKKYKILFESTLDGIFVLDAETMKVVLANKAIAKIYGFDSGEDIVGVNPLDFVYPEERDRVSRVIVEDMFEKDLRRIEEYRTTTKDGREVWISAFGTRTEYHGRLAGLISVRDITGKKQAEEALRESEERFRVLVEDSPLGVSVIGKDGRYRYVNPKFVQIFGYTLKDIPTGREWFKKAYPDKELRNQVVSSWIDDRKNIKSGESRPQKFNVKCKDGSEKVIIFRPVTMETGDQFVVYTDITERIRLETQLQQAQKMEAIGVLAGGIAHDFNNMLAAVLGKISIAQMETKPGTKAFELLTEAENAGMRAKGLTAKLITFSKGGDPFKQEVSIGEFVKDSVSSALSGSDIDSEFTIPDDLWPVNIDEVQMKHVIHNIITNAVEAMSTCADGAAGRSGQGTIKVSCENVEIGEKDGLTLKAGKYVKISLKDQGYGIPEENLSKIFDPYYSTKEMGTDKGMGLGLSISHSIVKKHGGLITVESELGVGTTFFICLPESDLGLRNAGLGLERKLRTKKKPIIGKRKIFVMDDEEMVRNVTAAMLNKFGYEVELAVEGSEAIEMYKKAKESDQSYDGVILDLTNKIGMGGKEAIKKLLEIDPDVKAIVSTGYSYDPIVTKFREYGFCGALTKPFSMDELGKTVRKVLE